MNFVGIDYSLSKTGLVIQRPKLREECLIKVKSKSLRRGVEIPYLVNERIGESSFVCMEDMYSSFKSPGNAIKVAKVWGMLVKTLLDDHHSVLIVNPATVRSFIYPHRFGDFSNALPIIRKQYSFYNDSEDINAAFVIMNMGWLWYRLRRKKSLSAIDNKKLKVFTERQCSIMQRKDFEFFYIRVSGEFNG